MNVKILMTDFLSLFFPPLCINCEEPLLKKEGFFCLDCFLKLPKTNYHLIEENLAVERFSGKIPLVRATSYFYYNKEGMAQKAIAEIKYKGNQKLGRWLGSLLAKELSATDFFNGIDYIIPVPLHKSKQRKRGFNQAEEIALGISSITNIPLCTENIYRKKDNISQTQKNVYDRWKNTKDIFEIKDIELFKEKHILIVDDVLTTGSTLESVGHCVLKSPDSKVSILTLAIA